ncbi:uncharacterized protein EV154DRAFT_531125, partial [Mucor mucedo]|uniref:uncharacterized protein n=1 Tax=Mucor mucedo TaxID=29922 RepID=UPI00221F625B
MRCNHLPSRVILLMLCLISCPPSVFFRRFAVFSITPILSDLVSLALVCPITPIVLLVANKDLL